MGTSCNGQVATCRSFLDKHVSYTSCLFAAGSSKLLLTSLVQSSQDTSEHNQSILIPEQYAGRMDNPHTCNAQVRYLSKLALSYDCRCNSLLVDGTGVRRPNSI